MAHKMVKSMFDHFLLISTSLNELILKIIKKSIKFISFSSQCKKLTSPTYILN